LISISTTTSLDINIINHLLISSTPSLDINININNIS